MQITHFQQLNKELNEHFQTLIPIEFEWVSYTQELSHNYPKDNKFGNNLATEYWYGLYKEVLYIARAISYITLNSAPTNNNNSLVLSKDIILDGRIDARYTATAKKDIKTFRIELNNIERLSESENAWIIQIKNAPQRYSIFTSNPQFVYHTLFQSYNIPTQYIDTTNEKHWLQKLESLLQKQLSSCKYISSFARVVVEQSMQQHSTDSTSNRYGILFLLLAILLLLWAFSLGGWGTIGFLIFLGPLMIILGLLGLGLLFRGIISKPIKIVDFYKEKPLLFAFDDTYLYVECFVLIDKIQLQSEIEQYKILDFQQLKRTSFNTIELIGQQIIEIYTTESDYFIQEFTKVHPTIIIS